MVKYTYVLQEREHMRSSSGPWQFDLLIVGDLDHDKPTLHAVVDWQDGLTIFHSEGLEPADWPKIAEQIGFAMKDAHANMNGNAIWNSPQ